MKLKSTITALAFAALMPQMASAQTTSVIFSDDFSSMSLDGWTVIDADNDGKGWSVKSDRYSNNQPAAHAQYGRPSNDWLITPALQLTAGREYTLKMKYGHAGYSPEIITIAYGTAPTAEAMTTMLLESSDVNTAFDTAPVEFEQTFTPEADGVYYIGVHSGGYDKYYLIVDDFSLEAAVNSAAPAAATVSVVAGERGALQADVTIVCPTKDISGNDLTQPLTKVVLSRDGQTIKTWENDEITATLNYTDTEAKQGANAYTVQVYNEAGEGMVASVMVNLGVDVPAGVLDAVVSDDEVDGMPALRINWSAVGEEGANGGYVDPAQVKYNIYDVVQSYYSTTIQLKGTTEPGVTTYDLGSNPDEGEQRDIYQLYAVDAENVAGLSEAYYVGGVRIVGEPYMLPYDETVALGKLSDKLYWSEKSTSTSAIHYTSSSESFDDALNSGCLSWTPNDETDLYMFNTGKISLEGAVNPVVRFAAKSTPGTQGSLSVAVLPQGGEMVRLATIDFSTISEEGWQTAKADLSQFADSRYVIVKFIFEGVKSTAIYLDDIHVADELSDNLTLSMQAPANAVVGSEMQVNITVENNGGNDASAYTVRLMADDEEVWSINETETLASHAKKVYTATYVPSIFLTAEKAELKAVVEYEDDLDDDDNEAVATVELKAPTAPKAEDLMAQNNDGTVALSWQQPSSLMMAITEDFESYRPNTVDGGESTTSAEKNLWGEWSTIDKDASWTESYFTTKMPFDGYKYAFVLYNPELWNAAMLEALPALQPHSGSQYMMSTHNASFWSTPAQNNWLVSPELDGQAQEISFWVRSYSETDAETYTVRYSTTDAEADSFTEVEGAAGSVLGEWTEVKVQLPEGTKRFAICQTTANNANIFMLDDVTYYSNAGEIASYNVYVDGELVANVGADELLQYEVEGLAEGDHEFAVTVVYADGMQSQPVVTTVMVTTGIVTASRQAAPTEMYNLKGQTVGAGYRGIVVSGGKKMVK
ncbi:MAG: choice-of-anchor J domain-containing protein [Prevotella sp.]|nr:choice-of-anchor J domain-containing protein [Prevotella sp.]